MPDSDAAAPPPKRKRRWRRRLAILLTFAVLLLLWINGPGWRWAAHRWLPSWLQNREIRFSADFEGTLSHGITIRNLKVSGAKIRQLTAESVYLHAPLETAWNRKLQRVALRNLHLDWDLDGPDFPASPDPDPARPKQTLDQILATARTHALPVEVEILSVSAAVHRGRETLARLGPTDLLHTPGSPTFQLRLGALEFGPGHALEPQATALTWDPDRLHLDRFALTRRLALEAVTATRLDLPYPHLSALVSFDETRLRLNAETDLAQLELTGAPLRLSEVLAEFARELPADATLTAARAQLRHWTGPLETWEGSVQLSAESITHPEFSADQLQLDLSHQPSGATLDARLQAFDTTATLQAKADYSSPERFWENAGITASLRLPDLDRAFAAARERYAFLPADRPPLPPSSISIDATSRLTPSGIETAEARWTLTPAPSVQAPALTGATTWHSDQRLETSLQVASARIQAGLTLDTLRYHGQLSSGAFQPSVLNPWLAPFGVELPERLKTDLVWQGEGSIRENLHSGDSTIRQVRWQPPATPENPEPEAILATLDARYRWPETVEIGSLSARTGSQSIAASARWALDRLEIPRLEWKDDDAILVHGQARLPLPLDRLQPKEYFLIEDPIEVFLESEWITTERLARWLPNQELPVRGAARAEIRITGSPAKPEVSAETAVRDVVVPDQPQAPSVEGLVNLRSNDGQLRLEGRFTPKGYPAVTLDGNFPFAPRDWALDPASLQTAPLTVDARLPRLELATLQPFLPKSTTLSGTLEGDFHLKGTPKKPEYQGNLALRNASVRLPNPSVPPIDRVNAAVRLDARGVELSSLTLESAGGSLRGSGSLRLRPDAEPTLDFRLAASAMPLLRDESMIVRGDSSITLTGPLSSPEIRGNLDLIDSLFYKDFEILPVRVPFTAPARPKLPAIEAEERSASADSPLAAWKLDIRVRTRDPLLIRGNLATGSATGDIRVGGTLHQPALSGKITLDEATARLPFSTLRVRNGTATFTPGGGLFPELNFRGSSSISGYDVNVFFYGPANAPKTALTSDPPLPESEIMTLLATGTTTSGLESGQAASLKAAQLLVEEWRRGRVPFAETLAEGLEILNHIDVRVGEDDPLTGRRQNSATLQLSQRIYVSGSVDKQGNTRVLGAFVIRFK